MDIKSLNQNVLSNSRLDNQSNAARQSTNSAQNESSTTASDKVTLTGVSTQVKELEGKTQSSEVDNSERIAQLKAAIQEGRYQVDADQVASKLMETEYMLSPR
ncbi:MAG: flagellar biosynthesis anti-sigma factor FlgM [Hydrogenovibrio sp.]|uniref:flagellar biosynthesis anti-sigma factor FlgM n=1 Tax=Hydrogenovibrio sp. TaxID=2065821 RepID=UPI00286FC5B0|nr:flagellar biosynthesis anti-sigma factor FlgM [Hydrogenovibrio sp.]MDR9499342.1 flagellar biosynthesis anti-sigma factor FlgM [Hydrogenovibrio sp.]